MFSIPPKMPAASLLLKGFHTRYSMALAGASFPTSVALAEAPMLMRFSP
jgi:hypothetical protein